MCSIGRLIILCCLLLLPGTLCAAEIKSRYVTVQFASRELLSEFNEELELGRKLDSYARKRPVVTVEDEVLAKVDTVVEKAESILEMFPDKLHVRIVLLADKDEVAQVFLQKHNKKVDYLAFYSLSEDTIYLSVDDVNLEVLAHEMGHAIVDRYFDVRPPYNIHELMAQFVEKRIND
jgi:hypothetical protein